MSARKGLLILMGVAVVLEVGAVRGGGEVKLPASVEEPARAIAVTGDGARAVVVGGRFSGLLQEPRPGFAVVVDLVGGKVERELPGQKDGESGVVILGGKSPTVVVSSYDGSILLSALNGESGGKIIALEAGAITALAASADGGFVAAGYRGDQGEETVSVVRCDAEGRVLKRYTAGSSAVRSVACSPDGKTIAFCDIDDGDLTLMDVGTGKRRVLRGHVSPPRQFVIADEANAVAFATDGSLVVGGQSGHRKQPTGWIERWDVQTGKVLKKASCEEAVGFVDARGDVVAAIEGSVLRLRALESLKPLERGAGRVEDVAAVRVFEDGKRVVYVTRVGKIAKAEVGQ